MGLDLNVMNARFRFLGTGILRFRWVLLAALVLLDIFAAFGLQKVQMRSSWDSWFLADDPIRRYTERFEDYFGNSDGMAILVTADDVFAPEVLSMIRQLGDEIERKVPFVDDVTSISEFEFSRGTEDGMLVGNLVPDVIPTDVESLNKIRQMAYSKENLVNKLFSEDGTQTWIAINLKPIPDDFMKAEGKEPLYIVGEKLNQVIYQDKYKDFDLKETGMPVVAYDKTNFFTKEVGRITMYTMIAAVILLIITLRSLTGLIVPIFTMASSVLVSYGLMGYLGVAIDTMAVTIPLYLGLAISIGYSIHIINFFMRKFKKTGLRRESVIYAIENTGWPLFFTALTTIGSVLSFNFVNITTIRWIGNASAAIILVVYFFAMIMTPILLSIGKNKVPETEKAEEKANPTDKYFIKLGNWALANGKKSVIVFTLLTIVLGIGVSRVYVDFDVFNGFGLKIPYVKRLWEVTQSTIGSLYSYNIVVELPDDNMAKDPKVLMAFEELESRVKKLPLTKTTSSILDIIKDMNRTLHNDDESYYRIPNDKALVNELLFLYELSGGENAVRWLDVGDGYRILRLNVSINSFIAKEVEEEMAFIERTVTELFPESSYGMVGTMIEGAVIQNYIATGQLMSFLIALSVIGVLMIIVFRSVKAGLIALIPNLFPVLVIGGIMGLLGIPLDMMTMTIIPMLMGIAVDDSIHFINHVKLSVTNMGDYTEGILHTFKTVGKALLMTTFILITTFSMYMTSIAKFYVVLGSLVILGLVSALVSDYLLTPVLIRWSKPFKKEEFKHVASGVPVQISAR